MNQDRLKMARHALQEALPLDPRLAAAHEALGFCLFRERAFAGAEQSYLAALTFDRRLPRAHAGLGSIYMLRFLDDAERTDQRDLALEHWHRSLELDSNQPRVRDFIARYSPRTVDPATALARDDLAP
jgi:Tfp pilus assembly protein PilF